MTKTMLCFAAAAAFAVGAPVLAVAKAKPDAATAATPATPAAPGSSSATPATPATPPASTPPEGTPPSSSTPPGASGAATGSSSDTSATAPASAIATGMSLKDNTGAVIGSVTDIKADSSGQKMAVIKMGADQFSVATNNLAVQDGAAVINMTQAELAAKLHPAK
jgi:hypothetical protein